MTGPLVLLGGSEHTDGCEPIDRWLLDSTGRDRPVVGVLPFASSRRTRARTVGRAVTWWQDLGALALVAGPTPGHAAFVIDHADVLVLTGGVPDRLHARLEGSAVWSHVMTRWQAGTPVAGSSSGAMIMGAARQSVRPPFRVRDGFGLLPGVAIAPHHQLPLPRWVAAWRARSHPHLTIVGIDDRTALIGGRGPELQVIGAGEVVVHRGTASQRYSAGAVLGVEQLGLLPPRDESSPDVPWIGIADRRPQVA